LYNTVVIKLPTFIAKEVTYHCSHKPWG